MKLFKKDWAPGAADEWTIHDLVASVLSATSYFLVAIGTAGAILMLTWGWITLAVGIVCVVLTYRVIDPKLRSLSGDFEKKQVGYLDQAERTTRWEHRDGG